MIRVRWHDRDRLASPALWAETRSLGFDPAFVVVSAGATHARSLVVSELDSLSLDPGRIGGWVWTPHWSVTAFLEALSPYDRSQVAACLRDAVLYATQVVGQYFEVRHRDRGRPGPQGYRWFAMFGSATAPDGSPRYHFRVCLHQSLRHSKRDGSYVLRPADLRQLHELRDLFDAAAGAKMAERLRNLFGVRFGPSGPSREPALVDVPDGLGRELNFHRHRASAYLAGHRMPNSPLAQAWAAWATRGVPADGPAPAAAYRAALVRHGFDGSLITRRAALIAPAGDLDARRQIRTFAVVRAEAGRLAAERGAFTPAELFARSFRALAGRQTTEVTEDAVRRVLRSPGLFDLTRLERPGRRPLVTATESRGLWERVFRQASGQTGERRPGSVMKLELGESPKLWEEVFFPPSRPQCDPHPGRPGHAAAGPPTRLAALVGRVTGPMQISAVVSPVAWAVVRAACAAYYRAGLPVLRVQAEGSEWTPGSLARLVRDLSPRPVRSARREALRAATRLRLSSPTAILAYARAVYRVCRRASDRLRKGTLVVVENFSAANPELLLELFSRVSERGAKVLLAEDRARNPEVVRAARAVQPGRHVIIRPPLGPGQEQSR